MGSAGTGGIRIVVGAVRADRCRSNGCAAAAVIAQTATVLPPPVTSYQGFT
jgi:hypothetical protein